MVSVIALAGLLVVSLIVALMTTPRERRDLDVTWLFERRHEFEDAGEDEEADRAT